MSDATPVLIWKRLGSILKPLVAVELQLCGDLLLFPNSLPDSIQHQIHRLSCSSLVSYNAVVAEITEHRQVQHTLLCMNIYNKVSF